MQVIEGEGQTHIFSVVFLIGKHIKADRCFIDTLMLRLLFFILD